MTPRFSVRTTPRFARLARSLTDQHPQEFPLRYAEALVSLETDPYNTNRQRPIKKLEAVRPGDGQYRLRLGRFRFRYDIAGNEVVLISCGLRREDTYE
jgi:mRNA-degrading endonuclease RelE of RelBE toxin-antitoxin system